jgi:hypothetical protein
MATWGQCGRCTTGTRRGSRSDIGLLVLAFTNPVGRWLTVFALSPDDRWARTTVLWLALLLVAVGVIAWATRDPLDA